MEELTHHSGEPVRYVDGSCRAPNQLISLNRSWVQAVRYPHRMTGLPDPDSSLTFEYFSDGSVASRTDARGVEFDYRYDELGRLVEITVKYPPPPETCSVPADFVPPDRISRVAFTYDAEGKLLTATAFTFVDEVETLLTDNANDYDGFDNLLWERQALRAATGSTSPQIDYDWDFQAADTGNYNRLDAMTYPRRLNSTVRRLVDLQYGLV